HRPPRRRGPWRAQRSSSRSPPPSPPIRSRPPCWRSARGPAAGSRSAGRPRSCARAAPSSAPRPPHVSTRPARRPAPRRGAVAGGGGGGWTGWAVEGGAPGLVGERIGVTGPGSLALGALVRVTLADGRLVQGVLSPTRPFLTVPPRPRALDVARDYARLGVA